MGNLSHLQTSTANRPLSLRSRPDVQLAETAYAGQPAYVLKDPLTLELFQLTAEEFFLFQAAKVRTTLGRMRQEFERRFAPRRITESALQEGLSQLHARGLLVSDAKGQATEILERGNKRQRQERLQGLLSLLSIRVGSIDATRLLDGLYRRLNWLFSIPMLVLFVSLAIYAARIAVGNRAELAASLTQLGQLGQPRYWLVWLATIAGVKVVHELAHALTCLHVRARCHEIGVILLAFVPCLYCDVTDIWRVPGKWQRIAVSAAGMLAEVVIAALALIAWSITEPGLLNLWCLSVVVVCTAGTILINANPLLRYDGYYILADYLEVPNLASRAQGLLSEKLKCWLLNQPPREDSLLAPKRRRAVLVYAIAAKLYLTVLVVLIFAGLIALARSYRLENLVYTVGVITLAGMLVAPVLGTWKLMRNPNSRYRLRIPRALALLAIVTATLAAVLYWPIERSISGAVVFVPGETRSVYASTGGFLQTASVSGSRVKAGDVLARLENPRLEMIVAEQQGEFQVRRTGYQQLKAMRTWDNSAAARTPTARAAMNDAKVQLAELREQQDQLVITAPIEGVVYAPPALQPEPTSSRQLPSWSGSPLEPKNVGGWIEPGTVLCTIGNPSSFRALVTIDEADAPEVQPGQAVRILVASAPVRVLEGSVIDVAKRGSAIATDSSVDRRARKHLVEVKLNTEDPLALVGARGFAKIEAERRTLWQITYRELQRMLKLPW